MWEAQSVITERLPADWRDLQNQVARILDECGMNVEVEKSVSLARGTAEIDVFASETRQGRTNTIFCECKNWKGAIPQSVIHSFRSVVADGGANVGYIVASSTFQSGARSAVDLTNIRLLTWHEFQEEFESSWIEHHLRPCLTERLDEFMTMVELLEPRPFQDLSRADRRAFITLRDAYMPLGLLAMRFTTYAGLLGNTVPNLPLRGGLRSGDLPDVLTPRLLDTTGYREFFDELVSLCEPAQEQLRAVLNRAHMSEE
jgi:hypothetical protein